MKDRNYAIDFLKLIAIIAVVLIHVSTAFIDRSSPFSFNFYVLVILNQISRFAVPVFFAASGLLLALRYTSIPSPLHFYKRRLRLLIPYTFWIFTYFLIIFPHPLKSVFQLNFIYKYLTGAPSYQLYFIPTLFVLYLLFPLLINYKNFFFTKKILLLLAIFESILLSIIYFTDSQIPLFTPIRIAIYNLFPFVLGVYAGLNFEKTVKIMHSAFTSCLGLMALFGTIVVTEAISMFASSGNGNFLRNQWRMSVMFYSVACFVVFYVIDSRYLKKWNKTILTLSSLSFGVYFIHVAILNLYLSTIDKYKFYSITSFIFGFIFIMGISFLLNFIFSKIPFIRTLSGAKTS
ncbi:MAG: acyltransferase [Candidatus Levybacteria bacterium]|nr:acyltransferase [Candidatus Levybacteria bacterium]MBP9815018.1 acyltransferase [Candidatus Levybacteria bacterium]